MKCFKRPLRRKHWAIHKFSSGLRSSRGEMSVEDHPHSGRPSTSHTDENVKKIQEKILRIVGTQTMRSQKLKVWVGVPVSGFWPRIWTWDALPQSLFPACSHRTKKTLVWLHARSWKIRLKMTQTFFLRSTQVMKVGAMGTTLRTKQASSQWKTSTLPRPKKVRQARSNVKTMLIAFFDVRGFVHREFVPPGQTVNQEFHLEVLKWLTENVWRERPELWRSSDWFLHHDNAPTHTALSVTRYLAPLGRTIVRCHPPYSLDLAPCDFFLFPTMKKTLKVLPPWRSWKQLRRRHSTTSSFSSSRDASHSRKKDWTSVLPPMESILKGIKCFLFEM